MEGGRGQKRMSIRLVMFILNIDLVLNLQCGTPVCPARLVVVVCSSYRSLLRRDGCFPLLLRKTQRIDTSESASGMSPPTPV